MHKIDIPRRIIDRGIARRRTRQVYGTLDPARTALLVIDMQNCFLVPGFSVLEVPDSRGIVSICCVVLGMGVDIPTRGIGEK